MCFLNKLFCNHKYSKTGEKGKIVGEPLLGGMPRIIGMYEVIQCDKCFKVKIIKAKV